MRIGYARVSTEDQSLKVQIEQLQAAGCAWIFKEKKSGKTLADRLELRKALNTLDPEVPHGIPGLANTLVVTKLDRLARSTKELLEIVDRIGKLGASFVSLAEPWADTTSPAGKLIMTVFAGVAQFERERMLERCNAGRDRAKRDGQKFGRRPKLDSFQQREALARLKRGDQARDVARSYKVDRSTISRLAKKAGEERGRMA